MVSLQGPLTETKAISNSKDSAQAIPCWMKKKEICNGIAILYLKVLYTIEQQFLNIYYFFC